MKTFEELKKDLQANPDKYTFDETDIEVVQDLFAEYDIDETLFVKYNKPDFDERDLAVFIEDDLPVNVYDIDKYNEYIEDNGYSEYLYSMDYLNDVLSGYLPTEIIELVQNSDFDINDDLFYITDRNTLCSCNDVEDAVMETIGDKDYISEIIHEEYPEFFTPFNMAVLRALFD